MVEPFKLIEEKANNFYREKQWTYLCLFKLVINRKEIAKITITDHTWKKKGREKISKELILNIFKEKLNGRIIKQTNYPKRKVFKRERIPYLGKKYKIVFWFENNNPDWLWIRICHQQDKN